MSAISAIGLYDGQATPLQKTFNVVTAQQGNSVPAQWAERSAGTYNGFRTATLLVRRAVNSNSTKVTIRIKDPSYDVVTGATKYVSQVDITFTLPDASTLQNRKDIQAYAKNLLANPVTDDAVQNMSPAY
jgi:phosphoribosylformylglycinamidine (FGAM) synthase PurS component